MRLLGRAMSAALAMVVLAAPSGRVLAADDPGPSQWPTIPQPGPGGTGSDPGPVNWVKVEQPGNTGSGVDPAPTTWPEPKQY